MLIGWGSLAPNVWLNYLRTGHGFIFLVRLPARVAGKRSQLNTTWLDRQVVMLCLPGGYNRGKTARSMCGCPGAKLPVMAPADRRGPASRIPVHEMQ